MDIGGYISGVVSRLGFFDDNVYKPDPDCYCKYFFTNLFILMFSR